MKRHADHPVGLAALLAALAMVGPFSIDTFFPSFRAISAEFALNDWQLQQTLTVYMLPLAVMSLFQGPLSDALGRRVVILASLSVYSVASFACVLAPNFTMLLAFRAAQGMCAGAGGIVGRAVVRDLYDGPQALRLFSAITMIFAAAPAIAPVIGGWIQVTVGWRGVFGFMVLIGVTLALACYFALPETHPAERRAPLHLGELTRTALRIVMHREFLLLAMAVGANFAAMMIYIGAAPAVILDHWGLSETQFVWLFAPIIGGFMLGAWVSGKLAGRIAGRRQCAAGFAMSLTGSGLMLALHAAVPSPPLVAQQVLVAAIGLGVQLVMPVVSLRMLDLFPGARGSAASVQSCVMLVIGSVSFGIIVPALHQAMVTLSAGSFAAALIGLGLWRTAQASPARKA